MCALCLIQGCREGQGGLMPSEGDAGDPGQVQDYHLNDATFHYRSIR